MSFTFILIIVLSFGVIFVNGWTDAPNAIATVISTRSMSPKKAVIMAAVFNFIGVLVMTFVSKAVVYTISNMVDFGSGSNRSSLIALAAALVSIVFWAVLAWWFGIPTSESHALIAGITGAAIALGGFSSVNFNEWAKVLYGLIISSVLGFFSGYFTVKAVGSGFKNMNRKRSNTFFKYAQIGSGATMAFLHGAQDGQKFIGVLMLGIFLSKGQAVPESFPINIWAMLACSAVMGIGTSVGGYKIIKAVGMDMVKLEKYQGFSADAAASFCLLLATLTGMPVSTTHTKTTAIMGVGASRRMSMVNWNVAKSMVLAWVLTFPLCGLVAYLVSLLFIKIF